MPEPPVSPWATVLPLVVVMGVCMVKQVGDDDGGDGGDDDGGGGGDDDDVGGDYEGGGDPVVVMLDVHCDFVVMFHWQIGSRWQ